LGPDELCVSGSEAKSATGVNVRQMPVISGPDGGFVGVLVPGWRFVSRGIPAFGNGKKFPTCCHAEESELHVVNIHCDAGIVILFMLFGMARSGELAP
jgi:hypothetical protein